MSHIAEFLALLRLYSISLCTRAIFHYLFPVDGHLCHFHPWTTLDSAAMNAGMVLNIIHSILLDKYLEERVVDPTIVLFLIF